MRAILLSLACGTLALAGCSTAGSAPSNASATGKHPEARLFDSERSASADVDAALASAELSGKHVLLVMGANWCHDSRAFAGWMETPRFAAMLAERYEVVYVNVGMPQTGDGHNLHIARRFGIENIEGTPTVLIITPEGTVLNADQADSWRNAGTRTEDAIYDELTAFTAAKRYSPS